MGVKGSECEGWAIDCAPTGLQNGPTNGGIVSTPLPIRLYRVTWIKIKRESVKSGHFGTFKLDGLGFSCKTNKCSDAWTGDLGALTSRETSLMKTTLVDSVGDAGSMPLKAQVSK